MADYGTPLGTQPPGMTTAKRNVAKPATDAQRKQALASLETRSAGESRRPNTPGRGTSQGSSSTSPGGTGKSVVATIKDKQYADMQAGDQ